MSHRHRTGKLAREVLRYGDIDVALADGDSRQDIIESQKQSDLIDIDNMGKENERPVQERIDRTSRWLDDRQTRRGHIGETRAARVEQGRLWRAAGIGERVPLMHLLPAMRVLTVLVLAALDFYIFAAAYTYVDRHDDASHFIIGGLLGLAVFAVSVSVAHDLKRVILARAQLRLLADADSGQLVLDPAVRARLITTRPSWVSVVIASVLFLALSAAGIGIRVQGAGLQNRSNPWVIAMQALIPAVVLLIEMYLHDPTGWTPPRPTWLDRWLQRRQSTYERRLQVIQERTEMTKASAGAKYDVELGVLAVELADMNFEGRRSAAAQ